MKPESSPGFTIVEMMVVVVILGIASSIAVANLQRIWEREQVITAGSELVGWLEQARRAGIAGPRCTVTFSSGAVAQNGTLAQVANNSTGRCTTIQPLRLSGLTANHSITATPSVASLTFTIRGTVSLASGSGNQRVLLSSSQSGYTRCVAIDNLLGNIALGRPSGNTCDTTQGG